jgi:hypothetical protein
MSSTRNFFLFAAILAGIALLISQRTRELLQDPPQEVYQPRGRNNTILFLSNSEYGLSNVVLATSHAMLVHHSEIEVHFATFDRREEDISTVSKFASHQSPGAKPITFHKLKGPTYGDALTAQGHLIEEVIHAPGLEGSAKLCKDIQKYLMPWSGPEYFDLYKQILHIIDEVDPAVIAIDPVFGPGLDATQDRNRRYVVVSPNSLRDNFAHLQPWGSMLWKYPA